MLRQEQLPIINCNESVCEILIKINSKLISYEENKEYAKMPPTINNTIDWFCADANGNLLTRGDSNDNNNTLYWKVGSFD